MCYHTISISICLAIILSACAADKTEQAYSSISYHRHDVPLSYNFSQVHIYTKSPENRVKHIIPHKYHIEQHTNTIDVEKKHENIREDIPQENEHNDNEINTQSQQIHNDLPSDILQNVETLEAVNHQTQKEHVIKEHPQGFAYPQTQEHSTVAYNNIHFHGIPIQYYLNRATNLKSSAPGESINTNSLEYQNGNVHNLQNKEPNRQHPSFQQQYTIPTVQLSEVYSHNIANVPNKAFTKVYNAERPQYYNERQ